VKYHFKSEAEYRWACYLQFLKEHGEIRAWYYEHTEFIFQDVETAPVQYTPDFQVIDKDGIEFYQEYKGVLDGKAIRRFQRMHEHFPEVIMELILPRINKRGGQVNRRGFALKYCRRIIPANTIFRELGKLLRDMQEFHKG